MESATNQPDETQQKAHSTTPRKSSHDAHKNPDSDSTISALKWEGIFGLENAKQTLQKRIFFPWKFPHLFTGLSRIGAIFFFGVIF